MKRIVRSVAAAAAIAAAIQTFTVGVLAPRLPREVLRPGVETTRTLTYPAAQRVRVQSAEGGVVVTAHDADTVLIAASIRAYTAPGAAVAAVQAHVDGLLDIRAGGALIDVVSEPRERPAAVEELRVDYSLTVPRGTAVTVMGADGNVVVNAGCGAVEVEGNNSDVTVYEPGGRVRVRSVNGRIRLYEGRAAAELETVNGSIYAYMRSGGLRAATTNGQIVTTVYGDAVSYCDLTSMNGGITLVMSSGCSAEMHASSVRGEVQADLVGAFVRKIERRNALHGVIGAGHIRLGMTSLNGNIVITRSET